MTPKEQLIDALTALCEREGGYAKVAEEADVNDQGLYQVLAGVKLPSGQPRGVGPKVQAALEARYPGWSALRTKAHVVSQGAGIVSPNNKGETMKYPEPAPGYVRLPVLAQAAAGAGRTGDAIELIEHVDVAEEWVRRNLRANPAQVRVVTARGHSMTGIIEDGDALFVVPCTEFADDGIYVIDVGGLLRVKRVRLRVSDRSLSIESTDGSLPELVPLAQADDVLRICGRVIGTWALRKF